MILCVSREVDRCWRAVLRLHRVNPVRWLVLTTHMVAYEVNCKNGRSELDPALTTGGRMTWRSVKVLGAEVYSTSGNLQASRWIFSSEIDDYLDHPPLSRSFAMVKMTLLFQLLAVHMRKEPDSFKCWPKTKHACLHYHHHRALCPYAISVLRPLVAFLNHFFFTPATWMESLRNQFERCHIPDGFGANNDHLYCECFAVMQHACLTESRRPLPMNTANPVNTDINIRCPVVLFSPKF